MLKGELMERFAIVVDSSADLTQERIYPAELYH